MTIEKTKPIPPPWNVDGKRRRIIKVNALSFAQLIKYMNEGTYDCKELAELTGLHYVTVLQYTREMHRAKAAHICMWEKDSWGRDAVKIYKTGEGRDAKRSKMTQAQRQQRHREKKRGISMTNILGARHEPSNDQRGGVAVVSRGEQAAQRESRAA